MLKTSCHFCNKEIDTDTYGWGFSTYGMNFHMECFEMSDMVKEIHED